MSNPPAAAQALLELFLRVDVRETVCGDLLEEYREARLPALGKRRAGLWYWRQVGGIWLRAYWWCAMPVVLLLVIHDIFNTFRAPSGASYLDRLPQLVLVPMSPLVGIVFFLFAGVYGSRRTQRWAGGFVAALGMFFVIWLFMAVWWNATLYPFALVQQSNSYWIQAWQWSTHRTQPPTLFAWNPDTPDETFLHWIFWDNVGALFFLGISLFAVSVVCGGVGSTIGRISARRHPAATHKSSGSA